jgi:hypothetical protein
MKEKDVLRMNIELAEIVMKQTKTRGHCEVIQHVKQAGIVMYPSCVLHQPLTLQIKQGVTETVSPTLSSGSVPDDVTNDVRANKRTSVLCKQRPRWKMLSCAVFQIKPVLES